jgi:hypothetical protein
MNRRVNLHIDRLILDGLPLYPADRAAFQAALERELTRLIAAGTIDSTGGGAFHRVVASALTLRQTHDPRELATDIAQSIYGGLGAIMAAKEGQDGRA